MAGADVAMVLEGTADRVGERVLCRLVRARLPGELLDTWPMSPAARRHLDTCLTCQAQSVRYRGVLRALRSLRDDIEEAPFWLVDRVLASLDVPGRRSSRRAAVAVSAVAASVAVATAVATIRWLRSGSV